MNSYFSSHDGSRDLVLNGYQSKHISSSSECDTRRWIGRQSGDFTIMLRSSNVDGVRPAAVGNAAWCTDLVPQRRVSLLPMLCNDDACDFQRARDSSPVPIQTQSLALRSFSRNKRKRQPIGMLGRSSGNHDWLLANASACVSCGFRLRNARNASDCV